MRLMAAFGGRRLLTWVRAFKLELSCGDKLIHRSLHGVSHPPVESVRIIRYVQRDALSTLHDFHKPSAWSFASVS